WSRVMALSPALAAPGVSPRSTWVSNSSRSPSPSARLAARIRPASATAWSSSKVTVIWSGLWDDRTEQVSSWLGRTVASATPFFQVSGHLFATSRGRNQQILGGSRLSLNPPRIGALCGVLAGQELFGGRRAPHPEGARPRQQNWPPYEGLCWSI